MKHLLWTLAVIGALAVTGCTNDLTEPQDSEVSSEARSSAATRTDEVLRAEALMQTADTVDDLTGGFAVGLADETSGLDMELGEGFEIPDTGARDLSAGATLVRAHRAKAATQRIPAMDTLARRAPGDLIVEFTEENADGSVTVVRIFEGDTADVVRVTRSTTWPDGNLLLAAIDDEILVDVGDDPVDESDDVWLFLQSTISFVGGQSLSRTIDLQDQGGLQDDAVVEIVSIFEPRPDHPRLVDIVSTLTVDVGLLADEADDRFVRVERVTHLSGTAHDGNSPRVVESLVPEVPVAEGEEPCGGTLERDSFFRQDRALKRWTDRASWSCDGGGQLSRALVYADDTEDSVTITEDAQDVVTLEALERDGTETDGSYDPATRGFEFTTVYPAGSDPVQRAVQGSTNADETEFMLAEQVTYLDGFVERNELSGVESADGRTLSGSHDGRDESLDFELSSNLDETRLEGWIENDQQQRVEFAAEDLPDGSRLLDFTATEPGVTVVGHLEAGPDGCGTGTLEITEDGTTVTIEFEFCDDDLDESAILAAG